MFKLLEFIVQNKWYINMKALSAGSERLLLREGDLFFDKDRKVVFTSNMVSTIEFSEKGATIVLK